MRKLQAIVLLLFCACCMVYRGQVLGIPNVDLMVYSMSNGQAIETVAFVFPEGPHWAAFILLD